MRSGDIHLINHALLANGMLVLLLQVSYKRTSIYNLNSNKGFNGRVELNDGRGNALPCPRLAMPMVMTTNDVCQAIIPKPL